MHASLIAFYVGLILHWHCYTTECSTDSPSLPSECITASLKENSTYVITKCFYAGQTLEFECRIFLEKTNEKSEKAIDATFRTNNTIQNQTVEFSWHIMSPHEDKNKIKKSTSKPNKRNVTLSPESDPKSAMANLKLLGVEEEISYKVCGRVLNTSGKDYEICSEVELKEEVEKSNIFLSLIVIGVVVVFLAIIMVVFWQCPPAQFNSIDEMLEKLPTSHVEALKRLVVDTDTVLADEVDTSGENSEFRARRKRAGSSRTTPVEETRGGKVRINTNVIEIDNPAFEDDDEEDEIQRKLKFTANRLRRMSMGNVAMTSSRPKPEDVGIISVESEEPMRKKGGGVRFVDSDDITSQGEQMSEMDQLKVKIFNESKRRASIKPFKKRLGYVSSDSD